MIEAAGQVAGDLDVLYLVLAHGHDVGVVDEDVGRHEDGIGKQSGVGPNAPGLLVLVGDAALQEAHRCAAEQYPSELAHFRHVGLEKERGPVGIEAQGQQVEGRIADVTPQLLGIADRGQGMQVGDEVEGGIGPVLEVDVLADGAEVVAPVEPPGGLDAGKYAWHREWGVGGGRSNSFLRSAWERTVRTLCVPYLTSPQSGHKVRDDAERRHEENLLDNQRSDNLTHGFGPEFAERGRQGVENLY